MNEARDKMVEALQEFAEEHEEYRDLRSNAERELLQVTRFVKNEVLDVADTVE